jgi:hypothetical protein
MKSIERLSSSFRTYPYRERLPLAVAALGVCAAILILDKRPTTPIDGIWIAAVVLARLCRARGRLHSFFLGIAAGALLAEIATSHIFQKLW